MEIIDSILLVLTGIAVRLLVPFAITGLVVVLLRNLDSRWQAEAERESEMLEKDEILCWKEQGLSVAEIKLRASLSDQPCWQVHRASDGYLRDVCLDCEVFHAAGIPSRRHSHVHA